MNYELALDYYNKSLQMKMVMDAPFDFDVLKVNISLCYAHLKKIEEARKILTPFIEKHFPDYSPDLTIQVFYASGVTWYKANNLAMAEKDFLKSYSIAKKSDNIRYMFDNIIFLSKVYSKTGDLALMEEILKVGEGIVMTSNFNLEEIILYDELCSLYLTKKEFKKLSRAQEKYIQLKDSVFNEKHTNNLMNLHSEVAERENNAQLASQEQQMHLKEDLITNQRNINVLISLAFTILTALTFILFQVLRNRKTANTKLNKRVIERTLELEHNFQDLAAAIEQRDATLNRISNDLDHSLQLMRVQCSIGASAINPIGHRYFSEIETTSTRLEESLKNIFAESNHRFSVISEAQ